MRHIIPSVFFALSLVACGTPDAPAPPVPHEESAHEAPVAAAAEPAEAAPSDLVLRGKALALDTHRLLPEYVGNDLNCTNCHLQAGTVPKAAPWIGVDDRYPRYRARSGKVDDLRDRINGCMERSMAGTKLPKDHEAMDAFVAYMEWLGRDVADGKAVEGIGMPKIEAPADPDAAHGEEVFAAKCASCHQADGKGLMGPDGATLFPALTGEGSYNIAAGMARQNTAAAFIKWNMPLGQGGTLTDQEAHDVAAYVIHLDRPDFAGKVNDWPKGDKPSDARY